jgi:hypothetical protein
VTAVLLISTVAISRRRPGVGRYAVVAATSAVTIWFSHVTVFLAPAVAAAYALDYLLDRAWRPLVEMLPISLVWLVSFGFFYEISYRDLTSFQATLTGDTGGGSGNSLVPLAGSAGGGLGLPVGQGGLQEVIRPLAIVVAVTGAISLLRHQRRNALILALPIGFMVFAVALTKYPTTERALTFTLPLVAIFIGHGIVSISRLAKNAALAAVIGIALLCFVAGYPIATAATNVADPPRREEIKPLLQLLAEQWKPGDALYLHYGATYAFRYYAECKCLAVATDRAPISFGRRATRGPMLFSPALRSDPPSFIVGTYTRHDPRDVERQISRLRGISRVWVLYSHTGNAVERDFLRMKLPRYLDGIGMQLHEFDRERATLLLYDLSHNDR